MTLLIEYRPTVASLSKSHTPFKEISDTYFDIYVLLRHKHHTHHIIFLQVRAIILFLNSPYTFFRFTHYFCCYLPNMLNDRTWRVGSQWLLQFKSPGNTDVNLLDLFCGISVTVFCRVLRRCPCAKFVSRLWEVARWRESCRSLY